MKSFGFIGCGNMGGALAAALAKTVFPNNIYVSEADPQRTAEIAEKTGYAPSSNEEIARNCDYIFFAVKPQVLPGVLKSLASVLAERRSRFVLVSMAAGVTISSISEMLGAEYPIIRIMPNIPAASGSGMILYCTAPCVSGDEKELFCEVMARAGALDELPERLIDAASAISGCGPAYVFMFIQSLADGGVRCGLPRDKALLYAAQTVMGSAKMVLQSGEHPEKLKDAVCSPAGSTIEGVKALEDGAFRSTVMDAVTLSYERTAELGKK